MLVRMTHRGACGCEENTGDGAGILVAVPDGFLRKAALEAGVGELPAEGEYAVGNIFVPKFENAVPEAKAIVERVCKQRGMKVTYFPNYAYSGSSCLLFEKMSREHVVRLPSSPRARRPKTIRERMHGSSRAGTPPAHSVVET